MKKNRRINGSPRPMAHLCNPPSCGRITLRTRCERCTAAEILRRIADGARANA